MLEVKSFDFAVYNGRSRRNIKLRDEHCWIDEISRLPNELLVCILSFLSLKEAAATSILSLRWRYLWTFTPKLDFDGSDFPREVESASLRKYVGWVDDVLGLHNGSAIEELRVFFCLTKTHTKYIDRWLIFALARKVQPLELNLAQSYYYPHDQLYTFPYKLLCDNHSNDSSGFRDRNPDLVDFKHLRSICMHNVNEAWMFYLNVKMSNLKHLVLKSVGAYNNNFGYNLMPLTIFIRASPFLQRLVLEAYGNRENPEIVNCSSKKVAGSYTHLKRVEFVGYRGAWRELEILEHILENAVALEQVIIDPAKGKYGWPPVRHFSNEETNEFRVRAKEQLTNSLPSRVNLKIL